MTGGKSFRVRVGAREHRVELTLDSQGRERISVDGIDYEVAGAGAHDHRVNHLAGPGQTHERQLEIALATGLAGNGRPVEAWVPRSGARVHIEVLTEQEARLAAVLGKSPSAANDGSIRAPMPGRVVKVLIREGDAIEAQAPAIIVEAMKMENELAAPISGVVTRIDVREGDTVDAGQVLALIAPAAALEP